MLVSDLRKEFYDVIKGKVRSYLKSDILVDVHMVILLFALMDY